MNRNKMKLYLHKRIKKAICLILSMTLILSSFIPITVYAAENNNVFKDLQGQEIAGSSFIGDREKRSQNISAPIPVPPILEETSPLIEDPGPQYTPPPTFNRVNQETKQILAILDNNTYFSELTAEEAEALCENLKVNSYALKELESAGYSLNDSILYAQIEYQYGFSVEELLNACPTAEDCVNLNREMSFYMHSTARTLEGNELDQRLRQYILYGSTFDEVKSAYTMSRALDSDVEDFLIQDSKRSITEITNGQQSSALVEVNEQALSVYAKDNNLSVADLEKRIADGVSFEEAIYQEMSVQGTAQAAALGSTSQYAQNEIIPVNTVIAPFSNDSANQESINLSTGTLGYTAVDATLPGRNGLDLVIARRYDSSEAHFYNPRAGFIHGRDSKNSIYVVEWGYKAYLYAPSIFASPEYDQGPYFSETFTNYSQAVSYANSLGLRNKYYTNYLGSGEDLGLVPYSSIIQVASPGQYYFIGYTYHSSNDSLKDKFGLGQGWRFAFSTIETIEQTKYLILGNGEKYQISFTSTSGDSNLKDYTLTDLRFEQESGGYGGAAYTLYYKDGKREFFNSNGQLIAIRDRHNNTITFAYSTQNNLPRITITDTLGRVVTISGQASSNGGHIMTVTLPQGNLKYTVDKITESFGYELNGFALAKFENQLNHPTYYSYDVDRGRLNLFAKGVSEKQKHIVSTVMGYNDDGDPVLLTDDINYYLNLKTVTHPTNNNVEYTSQTYYKYTKQIQNMGRGGSKMAYRVTSRYDYVNDQAINRKSYPSGTYTDKGRTVDFTGYPNYDPENLPSNYTYSGDTTYNHVSTVITFNNKHLPIMYTEQDGNMGCYSYKEIEYNTDKLPIKVTNKQYNLFDFDDYNPYTKVGTEPPHFAVIENYEYDKKGNVTASWSPLANGSTANTEYKTTYTYEANYSLPLTKTYKQDANTTILERNTVSGPNIIRQEVLVNNVVKHKTEYDYDGLGNILVERRYQDGLSAFLQTNYAYQGNAYLSEIRNTGILNSDGSPASATPGNAGGTIVTKYEYNNMGKPTKLTDANGLTTIYDHNSLGDMTKQTNPDGTTIDYIRDYYLNRLTVKDENGTYLRYDYTPLGLEYEVRDVQSGQVISRKEYDSLSRLLWDTDVLNGSVAAYTYDHYSRPISKEIWGHAGTFKVIAQEKYAYNEAYGNGPFQRIEKTVVGDSSAPSIVTTQYMNNMGQVAQTGKILGGTEYFDTYTYDYVGNRTQERSAYAVQKGLPYSAKWEYDFAGRVTKAYNVDGYSTASSYDALGLLTSATDYAGTPTIYTYDGLGRLLEEKGIVEQGGGAGYNTLKWYDYDPVGNIISNRIANNPVGAGATWARTDYSYDNRNRLEYVTMYDGSAIDNVTKYTYDGVGNTLGMRTGMSGKTANDGQQTSYTYNRAGKMTALTDPLGQQETYVYLNNGFGLLDAKTDRNGTLVFYFYDSLGRVTNEYAWPKEGIMEVNRYTYTFSGAKWSEVNSAVSTTFYYDELGRVIIETDSGDANVVKLYTYDIANNRLSFSPIESGTTINNTTYTYDNQNRLKTVSDNGVLQATYNYNINSARESLIYSNGTSEHYTYNLANWLTRLENRSGSTVVSAYDYSYYADGNQRTKTDHNNRVSTYAYDGAGRLKSENENTGFGAAYSYDRFGNRTQMAVTGPETYTVDYNYDANNRLTQDEKTTGDIVTTSKYSYDPNGNQLSKVSETLAPAGASAEQIGFDGSGLELYEYDSLNRLTRSNVDGVEAAYTYRADGLRHKTTRMGIMGSTGSESETTFLWDGSNIVAELNGNTVASRYVRGIGLILSDSAEGQKFYLYNGHGDVVQLANNSGNIVKIYDYDAFGNERNPDTADTNPFRYCAEYFNSSTGTYYLRARVYQPSTGRFLTEDPIRSRLNWYVYASNNPVRFIDPSGLVAVLARDYAESFGANVNWTGNVTRNGVSYANATVTHNGKSLSITGELKNGSLMLDDSILNNAFGWTNPWIPNGKTEAAHLGVHPVALGNHHASVIVFAGYDSSLLNGDFAGDFKNSHWGMLYSTLGAGSEGGNLVSRTNRDKDVDLSIKVKMISLNAPKLDNIQQLFQHELHYREYQTNVNYGLFNYWWSDMSQSYNSNSFAHGLLLASGFTAPTPSYRVPNWERPLPQSMFSQSN